MAAMLSWMGSRFMVRHAYDDFPVTVDRSLHDFFMEAMTLIPDEMKQLNRPGELPEWELSEDEYESLYHKIQFMGVSEKVKLALLGSKEAREHSRAGREQDGGCGCGEIAENTGI